MKTTNSPQVDQTEIESALGTEIFINRELMKSHTRYFKELQFFNMVKNGNYQQLEEKLSKQIPDQVGRMSKNPLRQDIYEFVAAITLATRFSIEGGLSEEEAYHLSDTYIQKVDACQNAGEVWELYSNMFLDFTRRVEKRRQQGKYSPAIELAMDYIFNHLHYPISLKEISGQAGFTETYFSYIFKKETGVTLTEFIHKKRAEEAESLLRYSEYTLAAISQYLGFCSQSHFTSIFKKYTGMTPSKFRKAYFRRNWQT